MLASARIAAGKNRLKTQFWPQDSQNPVLTAIEAQKLLQNMGPQQAITKGSTPDFSQIQPEAMP